MQPRHQGQFPQNFPHNDHPQEKEKNGPYFRVCISWKICKMIPFFKNSLTCIAVNCILQIVKILKLCNSHYFGNPGCGGGGKL